MFNQQAQEAFQLYQRLSAELTQHKNTLDLLRKIKTGETDIASVIVNEDGWQMMPPRPGTPNDE